MEDTVIKDDPGIFLTEILVNDGGDRFDIIAALTGAEQDLIDGEAIKPIETSSVPNWAGIPESITQMPYLQRDLAPEGGYVWGVPLAMNADSFGYLPAKLNEPRPPEEASWSLVYESEKDPGPVLHGRQLHLPLGGARLSQEYRSAGRQATSSIRRRMRQRRPPTS